jgi:acetylglutamate kinase
MVTPRGPVVVKLGGTGVESPGETPALWRALIDLHRAERAAGRAGLVLVHGGGKAADELLAKLGFETVRVRGLRVTPPEQLEHIAAVLGGRVNKAIVAALYACGQRAVGLCPGECGTAHARRIVPGAAEDDLGLVGEIVGGDPAFVRMMLGADIVPVFSPIAINTERRGDGVAAAYPFLNVNADDVAASLAAVVGARTLVLLTDTPGVRGADGATLGSATAGEVEALIESGVIHGGMVPKVRAALRAVGVAGCDTVIASWQRPEILGAVCEGLSVGTRIVAGSNAHASPTRGQTKATH